MVNKILTFLSFIFHGRLILDYDMLGLKRNRLIKIPRLTNYIRINTLELVAHEIIEKKIPGSVAELGVYKGEFAKYINALFQDKTFYLFDTFEGFNAKDIEQEHNHELSKGNQDFSETSIALVLSKMKNPDKCVVKKGYFPDSLMGLEDQFCFVSLDADLYQPILSGLEYFYPRLVTGGYIFIHDFNNEEYPGSRKAVLEFCGKNKIPYLPIGDSWGTVVISK